MRTIKQLLTAMGACERAIKRYEKQYGKNSRAFKTALLNTGRDHAQWFGRNLFYEHPTPHHCTWERTIGIYHDPIHVALASNYPRLKSKWWKVDEVDDVKVGQKLRYKPNREKLWPEIRKRLIEVGVKL